MNTQPKRRLKLSIKAALYSAGLICLSLAAYALLFNVSYDAGKSRATAYAQAARQLEEQRIDSALHATAFASNGSQNALNTSSTLPNDPALSLQESTADASDSKENAGDASSLENASDQTPDSNAGSNKDEPSGEESISDLNSTDSDILIESAARDFGFERREANGENVKTILIDAGHGGSDLGDGAKNGLLEKNVTLDFARRLKAHLEYQNPDLKVLLVRDQDTALADSVWNDTIARREMQEETGADYFISLHAHAFDDGKSGFQMIINDDDPMAQLLAQKIESNFASIGYADFRGVLTTSQYPLQLIATSNCHAIELDLGALNDAGDLRLLEDEQKMEEAAAAAAAALSDTILENPDAPAYASRQKQNIEELQN